MQGFVVNIKFITRIIIRLFSYRKIFAFFVHVFRIWKDFAIFFTQNQHIKQLAELPICNNVYLRSVVAKFCF